MPQDTSPDLLFQMYLCCLLPTVHNNKSICILQNVSTSTCFHSDSFKIWNWNAFYRDSLKIWNCVLQTVADRSVFLAVHLKLCFTDSCGQVCIPSCTFLNLLLFSSSCLPVSTLLDFAGLLVSDCSQRPSCLCGCSLWNTSCNQSISFRAAGLGGNWVSVPSQPWWLCQNE